MVYRYLGLLLLLLGLTTAAAAQTCTPSQTVACLVDDRFRLEVTWSDEAGNPATLPAWGSGGDGVVALTYPATGARHVLFSFFEPDTPNLLVKILDGRPVNGQFWVFASASTNVAFTLTVTDTVGGGTREYEQPQGTIASPFFDTSAFSALPAADPATSRAGGAPTTGAAAIPCGPEALCLHDGRFEVEVEWVNHHQADSQGDGLPISFSETSGMFWFFTDRNIELLVNVIDGSSANGYFWVHVASLNDLQWTVTVRDRLTGATWTHQNPPFVSRPVLDREALPAALPVQEIPVLGPTGGAALALLLLAGGTFLLRRRRAGAASSG